ncbi:MAG: hypothetical protein JEZ01_12360 [Labilibaculum sp.]|nr:hypothetical protein [Labilibaculum sp.]MBI9058548.1 hypothetical protein [Labilibaculum sp.]
MKQKLGFLLTVIILLSHCTMKPKEKIKKEDYQEIYNFSGNGQYEIVELVSNQNLAKYIQFDTIQKLLVLKSYFKCEDKTQNTYETIKIDLVGKKKIFADVDRILKDGTLWNWKFYRNWIINNDTTRFKYLDPLTEEEKRNPEKWLSKFDELYKTSSYVYRYISTYYFKMSDKWYIVKDTIKSDARPDSFREIYPMKEENARMIELKDQCPSFGIAPEKRDSSLMKEMKYESTFFEKSSRGKAFNFSAGWWYLDFYMQGGDTLKIKRYASYRNPALKVYKIPKEHGGRNDVLFIVQEPSEMFKEQIGGMYVIRPKNIK